MQVSLGRVPNGEPACLGGGQVFSRVPFRVHHQRPAVAEVHQVRGVPQALVDQGKRDGGITHRRSRGLDDTGHYVLEAVLVVSAGLTLAAFVVWFFFFAGASPVPVGIQI